MVFDVVVFVVQHVGVEGSYHPPDLNPVLLHESCGMMRVHAHHNRVLCVLGSTLGVVGGWLHAPAAFAVEFDPLSPQPPPRHSAAAASASLDHRRPIACKQRPALSHPTVTLTMGTHTHDYMH